MPFNLYWSQTMNTLSFHPAMPADCRATAQRANSERLGVLRVIQIMLTLVFLLGVKSAFAQTYICSQWTQTGIATAAHLIPPPNTTIVPIPAFTIVGGWHTATVQIATSCTPGVYPMKTMRPRWTNVLGNGVEKTIDGTNYTVLSGANDPFGLIAKFSMNGNALTPIAGISAPGSMMSLPPVTITSAGTLTMTVQYAWVSNTTILSSSSGQASPGSFAHEITGTTNATFTGTYLAYDYADAWNYNTVALTCNFQGAGTDGGTDSLTAVPLGSFLTNTFSTSNWTNVGIKTSAACNANQIDMTFKNGPGYTSPSGNMTLFGAKMGGNLDPSVGVALRRADNSTLIKANDTVSWTPPPAANTEYVQAQLQKVAGAGTPVVGNAGSSLITVNVSYQ
jgi:hypothetical protein